MAFIDREKTRKNISRILERINTGADQTLINKLSEYRSIFKKEVPLFRRSWAAAYLLMLSEQGGASGYAERSAERTGRDRRPQKESRFTSGNQTTGKQERDENASDRTENRRPAPLPEDESKRLFISVGKRRRVSPGDLLGLIIGRTEIAREDIGAIRILDYYSFVQVRDTVADHVIGILDKQMFKGRELTVNFAKSRKDADAADTDTDVSAGTDAEDNADESESIDDAEDTGFSEQGEDQPNEENI